MLKAWCFICALLLININCFSNDGTPKDFIPLDSSAYNGIVPFEIPLTFLPFARGDLLFPLGNEQNLPYVGIGGGNYLIYPSKKGYIGLLAGFSYGQYNSKSFSGNHTYQGSEQFLVVHIDSRLRNFRYGIKLVNLSSEKRIKPYAELYLSRMTMFTRLVIDERDSDERAPAIESRMLLKDYTTAYHFNLGIEIDLLKDSLEPLENNYSRGIFLHLGVGYAHGVNPVKHLDVSRATNDQNLVQNSDVNYVNIKSQRTSFSRFVPQFESQLRFINLSFGLILRI